jgi:hypothetical protein
MKGPAHHNLTPVTVLVLFIVVFRLPGIGVHADSFGRGHRRRARNHQGLSIVRPLQSDKI